MANKCYKIDNFTFKKRTKRINEDLSKCECIKNYKLDIANELLYIEYHDEINMEQLLNQELRARSLKGLTFADIFFTTISNCRGGCCCIRSAYWPCIGYGWWNFFCKIAI